MQGHSCKVPGFKGSRSSCSTGSGERFAFLETIISVRFAALVLPSAKKKKSGTRAPYLCKLTMTHYYNYDEY